MPGLQEQLQTLHRVGITVRPGVSVQDLLNYGEDVIYKKPYFGLLLAMGGTRDSWPYAPLSDTIWHFDWEAIENPGDYVRIALRMRDLAGGSLPLEDVEDYVDIGSEEEDTAWLSFTLDGRAYHLDAEVKDDWADGKILEALDRLLHERDPQKGFICLTWMSQTCLLGCATAPQLQALREATELPFAWLTTEPIQKPASVQANYPRTCCCRPHSLSI